MRDTPAPAFVYQDVSVRVRAFDRDTDKPTPRLLDLLRFCGEHPHALAFASDGRLMGLEGTPALFDPLIRMWRHDERVEALVVATVRRSREAGYAVYPPEHAAAIRKLTPAPAPVRLPPGHDRGISR